MEVTTTGRYRVLGRPRNGDEYRLLDLDDEYEPVSVEAADAPDLQPGWVVTATLAWEAGTARVRECTVERESRYYFYDDVTGLFEAARETWRRAESAGEAMASRLTHDTDGEPAGALYVFAEQRGERDLFAEMRGGETPIEPLVERVDEAAGAGERAAFVLRPAGGAFVCVYIVFERDGLLARTMRDTYGEADLLAGNDAGGFGSLADE